MIQHPDTTTTLYPYVQAPSAPLLPALPILDAVVVRDAPTLHPGRLAPWYRRKGPVIGAALAPVVLAATVGITLWASAPAPAPAPAPPVPVAAAPAPAPVVVPPAPAAAPSSGGSDMGGVAVLAVIAGVCCLLGKGKSDKTFDFHGTGKVR